MYWDNAATTWPKPPSVCRAMADALERYGANPGRSGHRLSLETAGQVYACRESAAEFFGLNDPTGVVFTSNCTMALNLVIKGLLSNGGHAVISDMEHNSVVRPLEALSSRGVRYDQAAVDEHHPAVTVERFRRCLRPDTKLILCTHASNVSGTVLPIREIGRLAARFGIPFAVDGAQSAGILPLHMERCGIDYLCVPGHKGLYGPMGTGMLLCRNRTRLHTLIEGGTGSQSLLTTQPEDLPDRLESGTVNVPGICGLAAGMRWLKERGREDVAQHEYDLVERLYTMLAQEPKICRYTPFPERGRWVPLLSINLRDRSSEEVAQLLDEQGVAVRAGLHCAPCAHRHLGTLSQGTVRLAPSAFTGREEVDFICKKLLKIARKS